MGNNHTAKRTECARCHREIGHLVTLGGKRRHVVHSSWKIAQPEGPPGEWHHARERRAFVGGMGPLADFQAIEPEAMFRCRCGTVQSLPGAVADSLGTVFLPVKSKDYWEALAETPTPE